MGVRSDIIALGEDLKRLQRDTAQARASLIAYAPIPPAAKTAYRAGADAAIEIETRLFDRIIDAALSPVQLSLNLTRGEQVTQEVLQSLPNGIPQKPLKPAELKSLQKVVEEILVSEGVVEKVTINKLKKIQKEMKGSTKTGFGSGRFQGQFGQNMGFDFSQLSKPKRKRSKGMKSADKKLSAAFKQANAMCRKKNGQFKKGKSQKDIAKCAHRLRKKM